MLNPSSALFDVFLSLTFVTVAVALAMAIYATARTIAMPRAGADTRELAGSVIFRISALHALILALVFAQEMSQYQKIRDGLNQEVSALADIYFDITRYGTDLETENEVRDAVARYTRIAAGPEWRQLGKDHTLAAEGWEMREIIYLAVLDLVPATPRQVALRAHMLQDVQLIATLRQERVNAARQSISGLFWAAATIGFIFVVLPYFIYEPKPLNLILLATFASYTGMVLLFIYAFSNPFVAPGQLEPLPFEELLQGEIGAHSFATR